MIARLTALFGALLLALPGYSAVMAADATADAGVNIETAGRLTKLQDLHFGNLIAGNAPGTVTISPTSAISTSGVIQRGGGPQAARFRAETRFFQFIRFRSPGGGDTIELVHDTDPSQRMTVRDFTSDLRTAFYIGFRSVDFGVGGTLDVGANQEPGSYSGTFVVTIDLP